MIFVSEYGTGTVYNYFDDTDIAPYNSAIKDIEQYGWEIVKEVDLTNGDKIIWIKK